MKANPRGEGCATKGRTAAKTNGRGPTRYLHILLNKQMDDEAGSFELESESGRGR